MKQTQRQAVIAKVMDFLDNVEAEPEVVHTLRLSARKGRPSGTMTGQTSTIELEQEHHEEFKA